MDEAIRLAKEITKEHDKWTITIFLLIFFIYVIMNYFIPVLLSVANRKNEIRKIRSERKLDYAENIIKQLKGLSTSLSIVDVKNIENGEKAINILRQDIQSNYLLLTKNLANSANKLLDYYQDVLISPEKRDPNKEKNFFIEMKNEYEKIL